MAKQQYSVSIKPLTGVHIGTGETLTPLDYKIATKMGKNDFKKPMYFRFSSDKILRRLIAEQKKEDLTAFDRASVAGNMKELQMFFNDHCTEISDTDYPCDVTRSFIQRYKENRSKDPLDNSAEVLPMYHAEGSSRPTIPGSSIKGSLRTAILNYFLVELDKKRYDDLLHGYDALLLEKNDRYLARNIAEYESIMQKKLLEYSDAKNDPFRCLSIADCIFKVNTQLTGLLKNISRDKTSGELAGLEKLQIQAEVLRGRLLGGNNVFAETVITIDTDLQAVRFPRDNKKITPLSMQEIVESCNDFYWSAFQDEYDRFYKDSVDDSSRTIHELKQMLDTSRSKNQCIFRVGRWSQVEFVTFEESFRNPKTPTRDGKKQGAGNTRTVFDYDGQYVPMGWCVLTVK